MVKKIVKEVNPVEVLEAVILDSENQDLAPTLTNESLAVVGREWYEEDSVRKVQEVRVKALELALSFGSKVGDNDDNARDAAKVIADALEYEKFINSGSLGAR